MIRVMIAEDVNILRIALAQLMDHEQDINVVAQVSQGDEILPTALEVLPDVAVIDIGLPYVDGITATRKLGIALPTCRTLILTGLSRSGDLQRALDAGAMGFLAKDSDPAYLIESVRRTVRGEKSIDPEVAISALRDSGNPLTPREHEVLQIASEGTAVEEIAAKLLLATGTVRNYLSGAINKLGARNRIHAIKKARESGWL